MDIGREIRDSFERPLKNIGNQIQNFFQNTLEKGLQGLFSKMSSKINDGLAGTLHSVEDGILKPINEIKGVFDIIQNAINKIIDNIIDIVKKIKCGIKLIKNFSSCFKWYFLEIIGHILYLPIGFTFWMLSLGEYEKKIWNTLEMIDADYIHSYTGFHLIHYSDSIQNECYLCPWEEIDIPDRNKPPSVKNRSMLDRSDPDGGIYTAVLTGFFYCIFFIAFIYALFVQYMPEPIEVPEKKSLEDALQDAGINPDKMTGAAPSGLPAPQAPSVSAPQVNVAVPTTKTNIAAASA